MVKITEGEHQISDGMKLYTKTWEPNGPPTAHLVFLHGFSDHCNAYYDFFPTLASPPYSILVSSFDQRGWGRSVHSVPERGLTGPTTLVLSDIRSFILSVTQSPASASLPLFLMGHSMGGAEALHFLLTTAPRPLANDAPIPKIQGLLLESPYIELDPSSQPNMFTVYAGKLVAKIAPNRPMVLKLDDTYMSHDPKVRQDWVNDPLCHDTGTLLGLAGNLERAAELVTLSEGKAVAGLKLDPECPVWLGHGDQDKVTSYPASRKLFDVLDVPGGDKTFKTYEGAFHKLHAEPDGVGERFIRDVGEWIVAHVAKEAGNGKPKL